MFNTFGYNCDISNMEEQKDQKIPGGGEFGNFDKFNFCLLVPKNV